MRLVRCQETLLVKLVDTHLQISITYDVSEIAEDTKMHQKNKEWFSLKIM